MQPVRIHDFADPRLRPYAGVSDPALLRAFGCFVAEGRWVVERILADPGWSVRSLLLSEAALEALRGPLSTRGSLTVFVAEGPAFRELTGHHFHRGCLALVERRSPKSWRELLGGSRALLVLDGVSDPDNVGSVFRNAAAFGVGGAILSEATCDPLYRKAVRTSMAATLRVPHARCSDGDWSEMIEALGDHGVYRIALTLHPEAVPLHGVRLAPRAPVVLFVGGEGYGLREASIDRVDVRVAIPIMPDVDSLNVATATGIALYALLAETTRGHPERG